jgi:hypothetical protein
MEVQGLPRPLPSFAIAEVHAGKHKKLTNLIWAYQFLQLIGSGNLP